MSLFISNCRDAFRDNESKDKASAQGTVPVILIIAGFAVVAILAVTWIGNSIAGQAHLVATYCISQAQDITGSTGGASQATTNKCTGNQVTDLSSRQAARIEETKGGRF